MLVKYVLQRASLLKLIVIWLNNVKQLVVSACLRIFCNNIFRNYRYVPSISAILLLCEKIRLQETTTQILSNIPDGMVLHEELIDVIA